MARSFCVIDIGTNAVKSKIFSKGRSLRPSMRFLSNKNAESLDVEEVLSHISELIAEAEKKGISKQNIYIVATEGARRSFNRPEIVKLIEERIGRKLHIISPEREAWFSVLGGLSNIRFKDRPPKQVLYIESGGGSTEISFVNTKKRPISLIASTSLSLGSKQPLIDGNEGKTKEYINENIAALLARVKEKGIKIDTSLRIVINASAASKIIGKSYDDVGCKSVEKVAKKQCKMGLLKFIETCKDLLERSDGKQQLIEDYSLKEQTYDGFIAHSSILSSILDSLRKKISLPSISAVPITTTVGGLKEGVAKEILNQDSLSSEEIEKKLFSIGKDDKKDDTEDDKKDSQDQDSPSPDKDDSPVDSEWMDEYESFFKKQNSYCRCRKISKGRKLLVEDNHNKVVYNSEDSVSVSSKTNDRNNKLFEDMILLAKKQGMTDIKFEPTLDMETKLRIYAACQKHGMEIQNFSYNPEMLKNVNPATKNLVLSSRQGFSGRNSHASTR